MSPPSGHIYVDPEGLKRAGEAYDDHAQYYDHQLRNVQGLRSTYDGCWGDDEMGREFATSFLAGLDGAEAVLKGSHAHVRYAADTLADSGTDYRDTEDGAVDAGTRLIALAEPGPPPPISPGPPPPTTLANQPSPAAADENPIPQEYFGKPQIPASPVQGGAANLSLSTDPTGDTTPLTMRDGEKADGLIPSEHFGTPQTPASPTHGGPLNLIAEPGGETPARSPYGGEVEAPVHTAAPLGPGHGPHEGDVQTPGAGAAPLAPGHGGAPEISAPHYNGQPLEDGVRMVALAPEPDGSFVFDANRYDSVTPVSQSAVSGAQGQPIPGDGLRFFLVRENPDVDPDAPGYRSLPITLRPDAG
ncbi:hypothetical protein M1L60_33350 [Actinoplanes sp. TRM 88003]|uniref:Uncharacterized protein n=1 Tax=Paractinoplanes aksuensis TaxID=2939490 RepID=A0ABT1DZM5_9ACTN|nr:hypothetical protein [Actinoplanes aksuensis]MCO8275481.1 hypothetical protein [Actinoplanes aksuensis]